MISVTGGWRIAWNCWGIGIRASFLHRRYTVIQIDLLLFHIWITLFIPAEMKKFQDWMESENE